MPITELVRCSSKRRWDVYSMWYASFTTTTNNGNNNYHTQELHDD